MSTVALLRHGLRPRLAAVAVIVVSILTLTVLALWMSQSLDAAIYESLPDAMLALVGIPAGADVEVMAYSQMVAFLGALAAATLGVFAGAAVIAGAEQDHTLALLLSHPVSRLHLALAMAGVLVATVAMVAVGLWAASWLAALPFQVELGETHLGALAVALGANALFCGAVSFSIAAATGNRGLAAGVGGLVVLLGWLLAGLLPMSPRTAGLADWLPWGWYARARVIVHGLDWGRLALLLGGAVLLLTLGVWRFLSRDLCTPAALRVRLPAATRGPSLIGFLFARRRVLFGVLALVMVGLMGLLMGVLYEQMAPQLESVTATMPPEILQIFDAADMTTPAGFYWSETLGLMGPAAVITLGAAVAHGLAADEHSGRLAMLLPMTSRMRLLGATLATQALLVAALSAHIGLGIWAGARLGSVDLAGVHIAGATLHLGALGLFVSAAALLAAASVGRPGAVIWTAVVVGAGGYALNVAATMVGTASWAWFSPFHWYAVSRPLHHGADGAHVSVLLAGAIALWALCFPLFQRRDLRC